MCGGGLGVIGSRRRRSVNTAGEKETLIIRRLRCKRCRAIHHELPDTIVPYKRHCAETIELIIGGTPENVCCEDSTISRIQAWWAICRLYFASVMASLREKYKVVFSKQCAPREIIRAVCNAHLWVHTRSAFLSG